MICRLVQFKGGQLICIDGLQIYFFKVGMFMMGGLLILLIIILLVLLWVDLCNCYVWVVLVVMLCFGVIGWYDDWIKIVCCDLNGLKLCWKYLLQLIFGLVVGLFLFYMVDVLVVMIFYILMFKLVVLLLVGISFVVIVYFWIVGFFNVVNLIDGLDGLVIMLIVLVVCVLGVFVYVLGNVVFFSYLQILQIFGVGELVIICVVIVGVGLGFLWFNIYLVMVFMGDIGVLVLGVVLGMIVVIICQELVLVIMGGVFVVEMLLVMIQVVLFKLIGKCVFCMVLIYYYFELKGWLELCVIVCFWIILVVLVLIGLVMLKVC